MNHAKRPLATQRGTKKPKKPTKFGKMLPLLLPAVGGLRETTEHTTPLLLYLGIQLPPSTIVTGAITHLLKEK